jgi:hypothetical protein
MTSSKRMKADFIKDFVKWTARQDWDWLMVNVIPTRASLGKLDQNFQKWIREVEEADGTMEFRWIRFIPREYSGPSTEGYVLVGGLSSGEAWFWGKRWAVIDGDPNSHAGALYRSRRRYKVRLSTVLAEVLGGKESGGFNVEMRMGPQTIERRRTFKTDYDGMPLDKEMRTLIQRGT